MSFINLDIEEILKTLNQLKADQKPAWGKMNAQQMVEHLTDGFKMASGKISFPLEVEEDEIGKLKNFLYTDKPMAKNISVAFTGINPKIRHEELELSIDEFLLEWIDFEDFFQENPETKTQHPYYGLLNYDDWCQLHKKHITHHFNQFGLR